MNDQPYNAERFYDSLGGYWLKIPVKLFENKTKVKIKFVRKKDETPVVFNETGTSSSKWLESCDLIDADHPDIINKANEIINNCKNCSNNAAKAKQIQSFVINHLTFKLYDGIPNIKASEVYKRKYGVCIDYSRLFVALCRAVNIPSRTVEGIVFSREDPGIYDGHHEWAEIMSEDGNWHQLDFTYSTMFDFSDIRYLDLIYATEESPYYLPFYKTDYKPYQISSGDIVIFSVTKTMHNGTPGLGYKLADNKYPQYFKVENEFFIEIRENSFFITN